MTTVVMTEQSTSNGNQSVGLVRALSIPVLSLLFALALIYTRSLRANSGSSILLRLPEALGGEYLRIGLVSIAILFGFSCLPGGLIGTVLGYLIIRNSKLASASLNLLRIGQWGPFVLWWVLVATLLMIPPGQQPSGDFFVWSMGIPTVVLGTCY